MNKKTRKHNIRVYTESVESARERGGYYVVGMADGSPLPKSQQYLIDLALEKMKRSPLRGIKNKIKNS